MTNPTGLLSSNTFSPSVIPVRCGRASANIRILSRTNVATLAGGFGYPGGAVYAVLGAQAPSIRSGSDYHMFSHNNDIDGVGDKFIRICFQSLY